MNWFKQLSKGRRIAVIAGGSVLLLLVLAWMIVPAIARGKVPGIVEQAFTDQFKGTAKVSGVSLGWGGPMTLEAVEIFDDTGKKVGTLRAEVPVGLWGLITGSKNFRTIKLKADLTVIDTVDASGARSSNLARALAPRNPPAANGAPATLPGGYQIAFEIEPSQITYTEVTGGATTATATMTNLTGSGELDTTAASASLKAALKGAVSPGGSTGGSIDVSLAATELTDAKGVVQADKASLDATVIARGAPVRLIDSLAGLDGALLGGLGDTADATISHKGTRSKAGSTIVINSSNTTADVAISIDAGRISAARPGSVKMVSTAFLTRLPGLRDAVARAGLELEQAPTLDVTINSLALPADPSADLRGASMDFSVNLGPARATVAGQGQGSPRQRIDLSASRARIASTDMARGYTLSADTNATVDGRSAGALTADLTLTDILDAQGRWKAGLPGGIAGTLGGKGVSADFLAPVLAAADLPIDSRTDIGPTLDVTMTAKGTGTSGATDIDLSVRSNNATVDSAWRLSAEKIETREGGMQVQVKSTSPLAQRILARAGTPTVTLAGPGALRISSTRLAVPLKDGKPSGQSPEGDIRLIYTNASLTPARAGGGQPVLVDSVDTLVTIAPQKPLRITVDGKLSQSGRPMTAAGELSVDGLTGESRPAAIGGVGTARVKGSLTLTDLPAALIEALGMANGDLFAGVAGDRVTVKAEFTPSAEGQDVVLTASSAVLDAHGEFGLGKSLDIRKATLVSSVSAQSAKSLLLAAGLDETSLRDLRLPGASRVSLTVAPVSIPLLAGTLRVDDARVGKGAIVATLGVDQPLTVENVMVGEAPFSGGLANLAGSVEAPLAALGVNRAAADPITGTLSGIVVRTAKGKTDQVATLKGDVRVVLDGPFNADVSLLGVRSALADEMLGRPGFVSDALGDSCGLTIHALRPAGSPTTVVTVDLDSRLLAAKGWKVEADDTAIRVVGPATADWKIEADWANRYLFTPADKSRRAAIVTADGVTLVQLNIEQLVFSRPRPAATPPIGPFRPGVFAVHATFTMPRLNVTWNEDQRADDVIRGVPMPPSLTPGAKGGPTRNLQPFHAVLQDTRITVNTAPDGSVRVIAKVAKVNNEAAEADGSVNADLTIAALGDATGVLSRRPVVNGFAEVQSFPTALADGLVRQRGVLRDGLRPSTALSARLVNAGGPGGTIRGTMDSRRAAIAFTGKFENGLMLMTPGPAGPTGVPEPACKIELFEITESLSRRLMRPMFTVSSIYKTRKDEAGLVTSQDLVLPLDDDPRRVQGTLHVNLGTAQFKVNRTLFEGFIKMFGGDAAGTVGRRLQPFDVRIANGVASFTNVLVPLGEYNCETTGTVDLEKETMDVVVWIPALLVTDEALGMLNIGAGGIFQKLLPSQITADMMVPFHVRGPIENPGKPQPDGGMFLKRFGSGLIRSPGKVLDDLRIPNPFKKN